jgi:hypothetical protein
MTMNLTSQAAASGLLKLLIKLLGTAIISCRALSSVTKLGQVLRIVLYFRDLFKHMAWSYWSLYHKVGNSVVRLVVL